MKLIPENFVVVTDFGWLPDNIEDSWVHQNCNNYLIYDRADRWSETSRIKKQKNLGQNIYDIFDFIINNYDNLPDVTVFCKGSTFFPKDNGDGKRNKGSCSEKNFFNFANRKTFTEIHDYGPEVHNGLASRLGPDNSYLEFNSNWYFYTELKYKYYNNYNKFLLDIYKNPILPQWIRFSPGGCYTIPKTNIIKYSINFYHKMREIVGWAPIIAEAHMMERALYTIFTCDYEVNERFK
jgi:hypothetical protein